MSSFRIVAQAGKRSPNPSDVSDLVAKPLLWIRVGGKSSGQFYPLRQPREIRREGAAAQGFRP